MDSTAIINFRKNLLIMILPVGLPAISIMIALGESVLLFAIPLFVGLVLTVTLAKRLAIRDAIAYPFVQYTFFPLLYYFFWAYPNVGIGLIIIVPMIYSINIVVGYLYFRFVKNKTVRGKVLVLIATLLVTSFLYSEHYGHKSGTPVIIRMINGDFGDYSWSRETVRTDTEQVTDDGIFAYRLERVHRYTPLRSNIELRIFARNLNSGTEYRIRLDDVMDEGRLPLPSITSRASFWSTMQSIDEGARYLLTTSPSFAPARRWVFELNMEMQTVSLLEQIHVSMLGRTGDNNFITRLYMVNFFNNKPRSVRLAMADTATREIIYIPIEIDTAQIVIQNFDSGWDMISSAETGQRYVSQSARRLVGILPTDVQKTYLVVLREGFLAKERTFELNMNTRTISEIN